LRGVWTTDEFAFEGRHFTARGQTVNPKPTRVPVWIGGNSRMARQRAAVVGDGWNPFPAPAALARTAKTPVLESTEDLAQMLGDLWRRVDEAGRDRAEIDVAFMTGSGGSAGSAAFDADAHLAGLDELAGLGVTWNSVGAPGDSLAHALETLERYGELVIGR
jgi:alkanesulfonate monooxygenase SsuD/methylene tetrahydromethanopterin reductase-like flavin-dependent oxidoreductase (luciferase family)